MTEREAVEDRLDPEAVKAGLRVVDVTDDPGWLAAARWEVAVGYSRLADPARGLKLRDIYRAICEDGYEKDGRSRTFAAMATDPLTGAQEIAGSVRLVLGREQRDDADALPIDAMNFVTPLDGWPHRRTGRSDAEICELGRFVISDKYRTPAMRAADVDAEITGTLVRETRRVGRLNGAEVMYALMPERVADLNQRGGVELRMLEMSIRLDDPHVLEVVETFSAYWKQGSPRLTIMKRADAEIIEELRAALPTVQAVADAAEIARLYAPNVTALSRHVPLVLRPRSEDEVARIVDIANAQRIALHPFSTGKNWGLGSKLPMTDDCVLVDLSHMDRIVHVDGEFAYAILEPGVTQLQLARHLAEHHPHLTLNFTGSFAHTGIVGNVLERGDGEHARVDDLLGVCGILGIGRPFAVGGVWESAGVPGHVSRLVAGPDLCGLFCQSNFGIVTKLAFRLMHKPERRSVLWGTVADGDLPMLVDALAPFTSQRVIDPGGINIGYANRFVQAGGTLRGAADDARDEWNFYVMLRGTAGVVEALVREIGAAVAPRCAAHGTFSIGRNAGDHDAVDHLPPFLRPLLSPLLGLPDAASIRLIYELTGTPVPADEREIDADRTPFGMKCWIGVVPPRGGYVRRAADVVAGVRARTGLNIKASFFGDGRTLVTIHFRTDVPEQVRLAESAEAALWDAMQDAGFAPYRVAIDQMRRLVDSRPAFFALVSELKRTFDPNGIVSPGRYAPTLTVPATGGAR